MVVAVDHQPAPGDQQLVNIPVVVMVEIYVPQISPFPAIRYNDRIDLSLVTAPPYDVIAPDERERLTQLHPNNIVHLTLGEEFKTDTEGNNRYTRASTAFRDWLDSGALVVDKQDHLFLYRLDFESPGRQESIAGLIAALKLEEMGAGSIFGHERTIPGPKVDRLNLWRATQANFEPLWFFASESLAGFKQLVEGLESAPPIADTVDPQGVRHRVWAIPAEAAAAIREEVDHVPLVIADGHHRYETSVTYRNERRASDGPGLWDATLAMITDPVEYAPAVEPIHRLVEGLDPLDIPGKTEFSDDLDELYKHVSDAGPGTIGVASAQSRWTIESSGDIDTVWLAETILEPSQARVRYEHHLHVIRDEINKGVTVFIMPATPVELVAKKALEGVRLPPKTTLFTPKPRSGLLMRDLRS